MAVERAQVVAARRLRVAQAAAALRRRLTSFAVRHALAVSAHAARTHVRAALLALTAGAAIHQAWAGGARVRIAEPRAAIRRRHAAIAVERAMRLAAEPVGTHCRAALLGFRACFAVGPAAFDADSAAADTFTTIAARKTCVSETLACSRREALAVPADTGAAFKLRAAFRTVPLAGFRAPLAHHALARAALRAGATLSTTLLARGRADAVCARLAAAVRRCIAGLALFRATGVCRRVTSAPSVPARQDVVISKSLASAACNDGDRSGDDPGQTGQRASEQPRD